MKRNFAGAWLAGAALLLVAAGCGRNVDPATAVADAQALVAEGKSGEARILLKNALSRQADLPGARESLARIALEEGDAQAAHDELAALATDQATPGSLALKARAALALGRVDEAAAALEAAEDRIAEPEGTVLKANLLRAQGASAEALTLLRAAQQANPADARLTVEVAGSLAAMGNFGEAMADLDRYLATDAPDRADALRARGDLKLRQGAPAEAVKDLQAALEAAPRDWPVIDRLSTELLSADALLSAGDLARAREHITRIGKTWPGMLGTEVLEANLALLEGRPHEAVDRLTPIVEATPDNVRLQYLLVDALVRSGNTVRATELLEKRVASEPATSPSRHALATLWMQQGRPDRVIELLGEAADATLAAGGADDLLAAARLARARAGEAIGELSARLAASPQDAQVRAALASAQIANGEPAPALATLGAMPARGFTPELATARMAALASSGNDFEINRLVDRLLDPATGADVATLVAAADVAQRQRRDAVVSRLLDRAAALGANSGEVQLRRASLAFDARRFEEAQALLQELVHREPDTLTARLALARVAEAQGDVDAARKTLQQAVEKDGAALEPALMLAALERRANDTAAARKTIDALIGATRQGNSAPGIAANAAGLQLAGEQRFEEARTRFRQAADQDPGNAEFWFNLGRSQISLADQAAARDSFVLSARLRPDSLPASTAAVRLSLEQKDLAAARELASAAVKALPGSAGAWLLRGDADLAAGDAASAREAFARAGSLHPGAAAAIGEFQARVQLRASRPESPLESWLARDPDDSAVRGMLGEHYIAVGNSRGARQQFEDILQRSPSDLAALNNLAWLLRDTDATRAEQLALQAHAIAPDNPAVADTLGMIYVTRDKVAEALPLLAQAAAGLPQDRAVQYHHALALHRAGRNDAAREALGRALAGNVDFTGRAEARRLMEEL